MKICSKCGESKEFSEFYLDSGKPRANCKACSAAYYQDNKEAIAAQCAAYRENNKAVIAARDAAYYEANKEAKAAYYQDNKGTIAARHAAYYEDNKEAIAVRGAEYCQANKETIAVQKAAYRQANKETIAVRMAAYYEDNKEAIAAQHDAYRENNKEAISDYKKNNKAKYRAYSAKRRALKLGQTPEDTNFEKIAEFYEESQQRTVETGVAHHVDHIIPLVKSGAHHELNLQVITVKDNLIKGSKLFSQDELDALRLRNLLPLKSLETCRTVE